MRRHSILVGLAAALMAVCGCGGSAPTAAESAPFEAPIAGYLKSHNMDMKVVAFKSLDVEGDTATALCSMTEISGLYEGGIGVKWTFTFTRDKAGAWQVDGLAK